MGSQTLSVTFASTIPSLVSIYKISRPKASEKPVINHSSATSLGQTYKTTCVAHSAVFSSPGKPQYGLSANRIKRFGQVIICSQLNSFDHALDLILSRNDHLPQKCDYVHQSCSTPFTNQIQLCLHPLVLSLNLLHQFCCPFQNFSLGFRFQLLAQLRESGSPKIPAA